MASKQSRTFACLLYPESLLENVWDLIEETHLPIAVSPLHDKDVMEETGELKKPHYHLICCLSGKKTQKAMSELFRSFGGVGCEVVADRKAYMRYLCHLDSDDKVKYNTDDIRVFGGLSLDLKANGSRGVFEMVTELQKIVKEFEVSSTWDLVQVLIEQNKQELLEYVQDHAYFVKSFLL